MDYEMREAAPGVLAFVHPDGRSNCGMVRTAQGVVLIDTTARPVDIKACLRMAGVMAETVCQVLITHSHSDHTSGIRFFDCPVLAHRRAGERIRRRGTARAEHRMPTEFFEDRRDLSIGGVRIEMIHLGGHTPCSSVVWLPEQGVLFAGDLIFEDRYPFLATADVPGLMDALRSLNQFGARVIVPGHGRLCDDREVSRQLGYIQATWERTARHIEQGHGMQDVLNDPQYPRCAERGYEKLHPWNIRVVYRQLSRRSR